MIWRLVLGKFATLQEIETHWSLDDVMVGNMLMDCQEIADAQPPPKGGQR